MPTGRSRSAATLRMRWYRSRASSTDSWERLMRAMSMPAWISPLRVRSSSEAGPMVAMIFVRRAMDANATGRRSRAR